MALPREKVSIPFGGGLGEDVDEDVVQPPVVARAHNVDFHKAGSIRKRRGLEAMNSTDLPSATSGLNAVFDHLGRPGAYGRDGVYTFSETQTAWYPAAFGGTAPVKVDRFSALYMDGSIRHYDCAVATSSNLMCEVWELNGDVWYQVRDAATKAIIQLPTQTVYDGAPRVVSIDDTDFRLIAHEAASNVALRGADMDVSVSLAWTNDTDLAIDADFFDVWCNPGNSELFLLYKDNAGGAVQLNRYDGSSWSISQSQALTSPAGGEDAVACAVWHDATNSVVHTAVAIEQAAPTGTLEVDLESFDDVNFIQLNINAAAFTLDSLSATALDSDTKLTIGEYGNGNILVACSNHIVLQDADFALTQSDIQAGLPSHTAWRQFTAALVVASDTQVMWNVMLASKFFRPADFGPCVWVEYYFAKDLEHNLQACALLVTLDEVTTESRGESASGNPAALPVCLSRINGNIAGSFLNTANHLPVIPETAETKWLFGGAVVTGVVAVGTRYEVDINNLGRVPFLGGAGGGGGQVASFQRHLATSEVTVGVRVTELDFAPPPASVVSFNDLTLFAGSMLTSFDGVQMAESSLHVTPEVRNVSLRTAVGLGRNSVDWEGFWYFRAVWLVEDALGNIHRAGPSPLDDRPGGVSLGPKGHQSGEIVSPGNPAADTVIDVEVLNPPVTAFRFEHGSTTRVQIYASRDAAGPFYLVGESLVDTTTRSTTVTWDGITPDAEDSAYKAGPVLYSDGGEIQSSAPPALRALVSTPKRLVGISAEQPWELWTTKPARALIAPEWSPLLVAASPPRYEYTAAGALDASVVVTTEDEVFVLGGSGPDDRGQGTFSGPDLISSDTGCTNTRSMVEGPFGVIFQGKRGFYAVTRGRSLEYIGGPTEDTLDGKTINSAVLVPDRSEVRFLTDDGLQIRYDYLRKQWSTAHTTGDHAALVADRYHVALNTGSGWSIIRDRLASDTIFYDVTDASEDNLMQVETAWIKLAGLQGYKRIWRALLLGKFVANSITIEVAYDHDETYMHGQTWTAAELSVGRLQLDYVPQKTRAQAIKFRITEVLEGNRITIKDGHSLTSLLLEYGKERRAYHGLPAANRK